MLILIGDEMMTDELRVTMNNCSIEKLMYALKYICLIIIAINGCRSLVYNSQMKSKQNEWEWTSRTTHYWNKCTYRIIYELFYIMYCIWTSYARTIVQNPQIILLNAPCLSKINWLSLSHASATCFAALILDARANTISLCHVCLLFSRLVEWIEILQFIITMDKGLL